MPDDAMVKGVMPPFISFNTLGLEPAKVARVLADYVQLEQVLIVRQLVVKRLALLVAAVWILAQWIHPVTPGQLGAFLGILVVPAGLVVVMEVKARSRLVRHLQSVGATVTNEVPTA